MCPAVIMSHVTCCSSDFIIHMEQHRLGGNEKLIHLYNKAWRMTACSSIKKKKCLVAKFRIFFVVSPLRFFSLVPINTVQATVSALLAL